MRISWLLVHTFNELLAGIPSRTFKRFVHLMQELSTLSEDGALLDEGFRYPMESFGGDR